MGEEAAWRVGAGLLERDDARERAAALVDEVVGGSGGVLRIEADAGFGKTAVLDAVAEHAREVGCVVLRSSGDQLELELAFALVRQLLGPALRDPAARDELLSGPAAFAAPALGVPVPGGQAAPADPPAQTLHGLHWLCLDLAERAGPLLLAIDDAHWADVASLRFVAYLARRLVGAPVALAVAARPVGGERAALLTALGSPLRLPPLTEAAAGTIVRRHRPDAGDVLCRECQAAAGGNPFLLTELAVELRERGAVEALADRHGDGRTPMARAVARRLDRVGADARRLAEAIALFEEGATLRHAAAIAALELPAAAELADTLTQSLVLCPGPRLAFRHPLLRSVVLDEIPPMRRARDHGRIADLLAADGAEPGRIAAHLVGAEPAGREERAAVLVAAADRAAAAGASDVALALLERAVAEPPPADQRAAVRRRLGMAQLAIGRPESADTLRAVLDEAVQPSQRLAAIFPLAHAMAMSGRFADVVPLLEAEADRREREDRDLALRLRCEAFWLAWQDDALREDAWRLLQRLDFGGRGTTLAQRMALAYRAHAALLTLQPADAIAGLAIAAVGDGVLPRHGLEAGAPMSFAVTVLGACDRLDDARSVLGVAERAFRGRGELIGIPMAQAQLAWVELLAGDLAAAESAARLAIAALQTQPPDHLGAPWGRAMLALALTARGDVPGAVAAAGEDDPGEATSFAVTLLAARGEARVAAGRLVDGIADLERAAGWCERKQFGEPVGEEVCRRRELALALHRAGREEEARALAGRALDQARRVGASRLVGESLRTHALVAAGGPAIAELEEAVALLASSPARLAEARAQVELGAALRRANHRAAARDPLRRGLDLALHCGAVGLARRAETELRATGAKPRRLELTGVAALTPSERRVAQLAAGGATNREIAQELFVTLRTVEGHLSNTFRKLDVSSRGELPADV